MGLFHRLLLGTQRFQAHADWERFAGPDWQSRIMHIEATDDFHAKQGRSTGRLVLRDSDRNLAVYLKRHYQLPRWRGLMMALWPGRDWSPAFQERSRLGWAAAHGIPVPSVVAAGDWLGPLGRLQSFLAVEELTGMLALHQAIPLAGRLLDSGKFRRWKATLVAEIARLCRILHERGYYHKDLYLCHFFVPRQDTARIPDWRGRVHLIDLQRLRRHRLTWPFWLVKDLAQLLYSSELEGVDIRDRLAFWRAYLGDRRTTWAGRMLRRCVLLKGRRYRRHNMKHRARKAA